IRTPPSLGAPTRSFRVEPRAAPGHVPEQGGRREPGAVLLRKSLAVAHEIGDAEAVDIGNRAAGKGREAPAVDRADVSVARVGDDLLLQAARGLDALDVQEAALDR